MHQNSPLLAEFKLRNPGTHGENQRAVPPDTFQESPAPKDGAVAGLITWERLRTAAA